MKGLWESEFCQFCGSYTWLEVHHIYGGAYRKKSEARGYKITLCNKCHNQSPEGVHFNKEKRNYLKRLAQTHYEEHHGTRADFIAEFGKSYILEDENV